LLGRDYPFTAATRRKAKSSVSELRRAAEELDDEVEPIFVRPKFVAKNQMRKSGNGKWKLSAAEAGTAHHKLLQHFALGNASVIEALEIEAKRLEQEKILSADERAVLDLDALAEFWCSELGKKIRVQPPNLVRRELPFTARFNPSEIAKIKGEKPEAGLENEFVVVQGVADLVVLLPQEIWLVDFKTDQVRPGELLGKIQTYKVQLQFYSAALARIYNRPVSVCALHFLDARKTVDVKI
jgi:ATP-dependent helicase/nuclease subunit A